MAINKGREDEVNESCLSGYPANILDGREANIAIFVNRIITYSLVGTDGFFHIVGSGRHVERKLNY